MRVKQEIIKPQKKKEENGENKRPFKSWNFQRIK